MSNNEVVDSGKQSDDDSEISARLDVLEQEVSAATSTVNNFVKAEHDLYDQISVAMDKVESVNEEVKNVISRVDAYVLDEESTVEHLKDALDDINAVLNEVKHF